LGVTGGGGMKNERNKENVYENNGSLTVVIGAGDYDC